MSYPRQSNNIDCGVYVCYYLFQIMTDYYICPTIDEKLFRLYIKKSLVAEKIFREDHSKRDICLDDAKNCEDNMKKSYSTH